MSEKGRFVLEIEPGNAAMQDGEDVALALRGIANKIDGEPWLGEGPIIDYTGNTVGRYTFDDHNEELVE